MQNDSDFPFMTMGLYESNAHHAREQSGAEVISFHPIVRNDYRLLWEIYSVNNQDWIQNSRDLINKGEEYFDMDQFLDEPITPFIHFHDGKDEDVRSSPLQEVSCLCTCKSCRTVQFLNNILFLSSFMFLPGKARRLRLIQPLSTTTSCRCPNGLFYSKQ